MVTDRRTFLWRAAASVLALLAGRDLAALAAPGGEGVSCPPTGSTPLSFDGTPQVRIVGMGGAGANVVAQLAAAGVPGATLAVADTNVCPELYIPGVPSLLLGPCMARGLGAGGSLDRGAKAAEESAKGLAELVAGTDLVLILAGLGGGTGGGAAPVLARLAREAGADVFALVTLPFGFDGRRRLQTAVAALTALREAVPVTIALPYQALFATLAAYTVCRAFAALDDLLAATARDLVEPLSTPSLICLDHRDCLAVLAGGWCSLGWGRAAGEGSGIRAAQAALAHPALTSPLAEAQGLIVHVRGGGGLALHEVLQAAHTAAAAVHPDANVLCSARVDPSLQDDEAAVTLVASSAGPPALGGVERGYEGEQADLTARLLSGIIHLLY